MVKFQSINFDDDLADELARAIELTPTTTEDASLKVKLAEYSRSLVCDAAFRQALVELQERTGVRVLALYVLSDLDTICLTLSGRIFGAREHIPDHFRINIKFNFSIATVGLEFLQKVRLA